MGKKFKYIKKYLSKSGNMVYVYPNKGSSVYGYATKSGIRALPNKITGSEYKRAASVARGYAKLADQDARYAGKRGSYTVMDVESGKAPTTVAESRQIAAKNRAAAREAERLYNTTTLAGAAKRAKNNTKESLRKLKKKTKLTASKVQNKVSKALAKLSKK